MTTRSKWPYRAPADDGAARRLVAGTRVPSTFLKATTGGAVCLATLPGLAVVFIYPWTGRPGQPNPPGWDDIPGAHGSTAEAEGFRDLFPEYRDLRVAVFGLSAQDTAYQRELADRLALAFPILSDADFAFADALDLPRFETARVMYLTRMTLVLRDGAILGAFYPVHPPDLHAIEVLEWIKRGFKAPV